MRRVYQILLAIACGVTTTFATPLEDMSRAIDGLGRYSVKFLMEVNEEIIYGDGEYRVDGDKYRIDVAGQEILGEGDLRYTVSHTTDEVVIESIKVEGDAASLVLLNPTTAFTSLEQYFNVEDITTKQDNRKIVLQLTPKREGAALERSVLEIDKKSKLPSSMAYIADGELVKIFINNIEATDKSVEITYPKEYEVIDVR